MREKQEARLLQRESSNKHLRTAQLKQANSGGDLERQLGEALKMHDKLRVRCEGVAQEHEEVRRDRRSDLLPTDVHTVSAAYETLERELAAKTYRLAVFRETNAELTSLVQQRNANVEIAPQISTLVAPDEAPSRALSARGETRERDAWRGGKSYLRLRNSMAEPARKKVALECRRKRMEEKLSREYRCLDEVQRELISASRSLETLEKEHVDVQMAALPIVDAAQVTDEDPEGALELKLLDVERRSLQVQAEAESVSAELAKALKECEYYRERIGSFDTFEREASKRSAALAEIHALQKAHAELEKELWQVQKELEFTVMRRDYAFNRARTVLGTHNEIRAQRTHHNERLQREILELERSIQNATAY